MKQWVKLIVENKSAIPAYVSQLYSVFGDLISVKAYSMDDPSAYESQDETAVLTSAFSSADFPEVMKSRLRGKTVIPVSLSLQRKSLLQLNAYPKGTRALLVNVSKLMAEETISQLYQAGYGFFSFIPYYPGCGIHADISLAVTPGEPGGVPEFVSACIDLGPRQIDIVTIIELAVKLHAEYILETRKFSEFFEKQYSASSGVALLVAQNQLLEQRLNTLVQMHGAGLVGLDAEDHVFDCNFQAASQLGVARADLLHKPVGNLLPRDLPERCRAQQVPVSKTCSGPGCSTLRFRLTPITRGARYLGAYAVVHCQSGPSGDTADHHGSVSRTGHVAKYRFSDICGKSPAILQSVELAKKMARTDSSILITGESGTGKELFAHAVHNNSPRAGTPFVAVNCAALPDSLLESELFGYEEGAFTGAKKGGKTGLFQQANSGTLFLDEIEGMSPSTQLKLLRVIQEREIMRVGGDRVIPINVRIVSASNQDLFPLMENGKFRRDLFYRLSTLPLNLPPLRRRKDDILLLMEEFKSLLRLTFVLTEEAKSMLLRYPWPGNIRELRNCVEYLGCQNLPVIETENLPCTLHGGVLGMIPEETEPERITAGLLRALSGGACGRRLLQKRLAQIGLDMTESQLRKELARMKGLGWVVSGVGRGGSGLTETGLEELKNRLK